MYIIMKRQKIFEVLIVKWVVKVRILGNASLMVFLTYWIYLFFSTFPVQHTLIYFPTQH